MNRGYELHSDILTEWMQSYGHDVWNFAFSMVRSRHVADDITQDVFLKAYRHVSNFRHEASVKTWLLSITRNTVQDHLRSAFIRKVTLMDYITVHGAHPAAEQEAVENIIAEDVWRHVLELPVKLREVLVLHAHHHLNAEEIASVLHLSESAVKSRLHRARAKMESQLKGRDFSE